MKAFFCVSSNDNDYSTPESRSNLLGTFNSIYNNESGVISFFDVHTQFKKSDSADDANAMTGNTPDRKLLSTFYKYTGAKGSASSTELATLTVDGDTTLGGGVGNTVIFRGMPQLPVVGSFPLTGDDGQICVFDNTDDTDEAAHIIAYLDGGWKPIGGGGGGELQLTSLAVTGDTVLNGTFKIQKINGDLSLTDVFECDSSDNTTVHKDLTVKGSVTVGEETLANTILNQTTSISADDNTKRVLIESITASSLTSVGVLDALAVTGDTVLDGTFKIQKTNGHDVFKCDSSGNTTVDNNLTVKGDTTLGEAGDTDVQTTTVNGTLRINGHTGVGGSDNPGIEFVFVDNLSLIHI